MSVTSFACCCIFLFLYLLPLRSGSTSTHFIHTICWVVTIPSCVWCVFLYSTNSVFFHIISIYYCSFFIFLSYCGEGGELGRGVLLSNSHFCWLRSGWLTSSVSSSVSIYWQEKLGEKRSGKIWTSDRDWVGGRQTHTTHARLAAQHAVKPSPSLVVI